MRLVYTHAVWTILWLSLSTPVIGGAFAAAERLGGRQGAVNDTSPGAMQELCDLLEQQYFERFWCIQEIASSSRAVPKCQDLEISFFKLIRSSLAVVN